MQYRRSCNLLVVSDLHLGADLKRSGFGYLRGVATLDREFGRFLDWYAEHPEGDLPWRLIVNGDMVDFINVTLLPGADEALPFTVSEAERLYGLSGEEAKVAWMLDRIVERHRSLFEKLAGFVARGNELAVVRGNHDVEFHWPGVQERFRLRLAELSGLEGTEKAELLERVSFLPWFYYEPGTIFVEHGHQYDDYSSFEYLLAPVAPDAPEKIDLPLSHFAIRYLANAFPNISTDDKDGWKLRDYFRLAFSGKSGGIFALGASYAVTVLRVARVVLRRKLRRVGREAKAAQAKALAALAREWSLSEEVLQKLTLLHKGHSIRSAIRAMQCYYVDRWILYGIGLAALIAVSLSGLSAPKVMALMGAVLALLWLGNRHLALARAAEIPPKLKIAGRAVAVLLNVPLVVMGHSHHYERVGDESRHAAYVNTGTWIPPSQDTPGVPGFTHLMVRRVAVEAADGGSPLPTAELRQWAVPESRPVRLDG